MKVALLQTSIGDYRQNVLKLLVDRYGNDFHVFSGPTYFDSTTKTRISIGNNLTIISNHFFLNRTLLFQTGMFKPMLKVDVAILEFNPRILSVWVLLILRRIMGKRSVVWGHAWPRLGKHKVTDKIRHIQRMLANAIIVYTKTQARELKEKMKFKEIVAAPNAIYSSKDMYENGNGEKAFSFIYVGRLVKNKKPDLLLESFCNIIGSLPEDSNLIFVGEGPEMALLKENVPNEYSARVEFLGHISDISTLRQLYSRALASVSPGYVGLSITQSFGFGVPMIIADDEPHAPELEAAIEGENCVMFSSNSTGSLGNAMLNMVQNRSAWIGKRKNISEYCRKNYSAENMSNMISQAIGK